MWYALLMLLFLTSPGAVPPLHGRKFEKYEKRRSDSKIYYGHDVDEILPFFVFIMYATLKDQSDTVFIGGSNLFHPRYAITVCHNGNVEYSYDALNDLRPGYYRYQRKNPAFYYGVAGTKNMITWEDTYQKRKAANFYQHPKCLLWAGTGVYMEWITYDIGVFEFSKAFVMTPKVNLIPTLNHTAQYYDYEEGIGNFSLRGVCYAFGFGVTETSYPPEIMKYTKAQLKTQEWCSHEACKHLLYDPVTWAKCTNTAMFYPTSGHRCATFPESRHRGIKYNAGQGDSGGPIVCTANNHTFFAGMMTTGFFPTVEGIPADTDLIHYEPTSVFFNYMIAFLRVHASTGVSLFTAPPIALISLITVTKINN